VLVGIVPWVDDTIGHELGVDFSGRCLGHAASQCESNGEANGGECEEGEEEKGEGGGEGK
jgi:hypothetical protein